jgi:hypothetical protein
MPRDRNEFTLPRKDVAKLAARLGIDPESISSAVGITNDDGALIGVTASLKIHADANLITYMRRAFTKPHALCECGFPLSAHWPGSLSCPVNSGKWREQKGPVVAGSEAHKSLINARVSAAYADCEEYEQILDATFKRWGLPYSLK